MMSSHPARARRLVSIGVAFGWLLMSASAPAAQPPITFYGDRDLAPFEFLVAGVARGANVDLAKAIGRVLDRPVDVQLIDWPLAQARVREGSGDEALMFLAPTPERTQAFDFTRPTVTLKFALFVRDTDVRALSAAPSSDALAGRRVGVTRGGYPRAMLEPAHPTATFVLVDSLLDGTRRLANGDIDALGAPQWSQEFLVAELGIPNIVALPAFAEQSAGMAVRKGNAALQAELDRALATIIDSGEFDRIVQRWSTAQLRVVSQRTMLALGAAAGVALTALVLLGLFLALGRRQRRVLERQVHERRKVEHELLQAQTVLRDADQRKDQFIAMLGHELRNPLTPVTMAVMLLSRKGSDTPQGQRAIEIIQRQVGVMVRLIDDLLDVGRITSDKLALKREPVALADVASDAVETVRALLESRGHTFVQRLPDEACWIDADRTRLTQVIANLLNNAAKYTPPSGRIELEVSISGDDAQICVGDNGIGIAPEQAAKMFELFHQEARALPHGDGGMGIGLWLTRRIVELHGGTIEVRSAGEGRGTTATVRLPGLRCAAPVAAGAADHAPAAAAEATAPAAEHDAMTHEVLRVVVADDNADSADVVSRLLATLGCEVETAYDGRQAIAAAMRIEPRLVLMDLAMPHLDGLETCRQLRGQAWAVHTRFVAMSGFGSAADKAASHAAGFDEHIIKPVDGRAIERLVASLRHVSR